MDGLSERLTQDQEEPILADAGNMGKPQSVFNDGRHAPLLENEESRGGMKQLTFAKQPLVEAALRLRFSSPPTLEYSQVTEIVSRLRGSLPQVLQVKCGAPVPSGISIKLGPDVLLHLAGPNCHARITTEEILVSWNSSLGAYPRFGSLCEALELLAGSFPGSPFEFGNLTYISHVPDRKWHEFLQLPTFEGFSYHSPVQLNFAARDEDGFEFRVQGQQMTDLSGRETAVIISSAGFFAANGGIILQMKEVHERIQGFFSMAISSQAKSEWELIS